MYMKKTLFIFLLILVFRLSSNSQNFSVNTDTIQLNIKNIVQPIINVRVLNSVLFKGRYYCVFIEDPVYPRITDDTKHLFCFSNDGVIEEIELPNDIQTSHYFDLFVQDNQLLLKDYYTHHTFLLDTNKLLFKKIKEADDVIYEDSKFYVTYLDFGEWGCTTWFRDKETDKEYELSSDGNIIHRINGSYFIVTRHVVIKVEEPLKLAETKRKNRYKYMKRRLNKYNIGSQYFDGAELIYDDTTYYPFFINSGVLSIETSFIQGNELFYICSDSANTYIAKLHNKEFIPIKYFDKKINVIDNHYSYRNQITNNRQLLHFIDDNHSYGLVDVNPPNINIHYLVDDVDSVLYVGNAPFLNILDYVSSNLHNINIEEIDSLELSNNSVDFRLNGNDAPYSYLFKDKVSFENRGIKTYFYVEDSIFACTRSYGYNIDNSMLNKAAFNWFETEIFEDNNSNIFQVMNKQGNIVKQFRQRLKAIEDSLSHKYGQAVSVEQVYENYRTVKWKLDNGVIIQLEARDMSRLDAIELTVFIK